MISLDEAIESAKISSGRERILRQQHYEDLLAQLPEEERYPFTMALVELDIGTRTGTCIRDASEREQKAVFSFKAILQPDKTLILEDRIVRAALRKDAGWWDTLKDKIKEYTGWDDYQAGQYIEDEYGEPEPPYGTDLGKAPGGVPQTDLDVQRDVEENAQDEAPAPPGTPPGAPPGAPPAGPSVELPPEPDEYPRFEEHTPEPGFQMPVMHAVESSNLEAVGYDEEEQILYIAFRPKRQTPRTLYRYFNVTGEEFSALLNAESKGKWFAQNIKKVKPYAKVEIGSLAD